MPRFSKPNRMTAEKGFTLIEVLIAIAILAAVMMSVFAIYTYCTVELRRAKNRTIAADFAAQMMEMVCATPYALANYQGLTTTVDPPPDNPARTDLLKWKAALQTFPTRAVGTITVNAEPYVSVVTIEVKYDNYGRETAATLSLKFPKGSP